MSSEKPDQIQASVAAALSRLRGDLGPSGATAPKVDAPHSEPGREMARPANDVRADPFFRSIQSPPQPSETAASRGPIPMTPFARMQAPQEPAGPELASAEIPEETASEPTATIEIPPMPIRSQASEPAAAPEPASMAPAQSAAPVSPAPAAPAATQPASAGPSSPLSRMMRGTTPEPAKKDPAQRDLLANLPPPPISEPLSEDTESSAMRRRRRNRRLLAAAGVVVIAAIGVWLWTGKQKSAEVPVIAADSTPEKVKPADEGGLQVPNQNVQVLENMSGQPAQQQGETVMPEPEQPVAPPAPTAEQQANAGQAPTVVESPAPDAGGNTTAQAPAADTPPAPEAPLNTAPLPEQGENATTDTTTTTPPSPETQQPTQAAQAPATTEQAPAATEQAPAPAAAQPAPAPAPEPAQAAQEPAQPAQTQPAPATTQEAAVTPTAPAGNTRVQLAAGKSEDAVKKQWAALQKAYPDLLGPLSLSIQKVDKGAAGVFYRLQAGPLADKAAAKKLCASLKAKGQDCIVASK